MQHPRIENDPSSDTFTTAVADTSTTAVADTFTTAVADTFTTTVADTATTRLLLCYMSLVGDDIFVAAMISLLQPSLGAAMSELLLCYMLLVVL